MTVVAAREQPGAGGDAVGQLIATSLAPRLSYFHRLRQLFEEETTRAALAAECRDPRIAGPQWQQAFAREVALLLQWAARRLQAAQLNAPELPGSYRPARALCLMPRHGVAVHVLRRAATLAGLGIDVEVGFPPAIADHGRRVTSALAGALAITDSLHCESTSCGTKLRRVGADRRALVVVTGRQQTCAAIAAQVGASVVGAAGQCAIVLSATEPGPLYGALAAHNRALSCTRVKAAFCGITTDTHWGSTSAVYPVRRVLAALHPTVVYVHRHDPEAPFELVGGYRAIACDSRGSVGSLVGFARDPKHGWPGDFCV